jgi:Na+/H+-dicarboxylate symporter
MKLSTKILIGLISGIILGLILGAFGAVGFATNIIKPFGSIFLNLIKMIIVPLVFASLVVGASSVGDVSKLGRMGGKTIVYYLVTTAFAVTIGIILANIIQPGSSMQLAEGLTFEGKEAPGIVETILNIVPKNPIAAMADGKMLQIIVFALFVGVAITLVGKKAEQVKGFFDGFAEVMYKITAIVMELAPYGVFALIVPVVAENGPSVLLPLLKIILVVYLGCLLHALIVYSFTVKGLGKMSLKDFYKGILPAQVVAFSTCSSSGTLPVTMKCAEDNLGVSKETASFVLPLGATINMDGSALYQGACAIFIAQVYGLDLTLGQQLTVVLTGTLASIGAAGVPGAGLIILTMVLKSVGLPLDGLALIAGIDRVLDMARTTLNITGDSSCAVVVDASEKRREAQLNTDTGVSS